MNQCSMILRYSLAWIPMVFIAVLNGAARDLGYGKHLSELRSHQVSTIGAGPPGVGTMPGILSPARQSAED